MRHFWNGFEISKSSPPTRFKKHVIILYFDDKKEESLRARSKVKKLSLKYPTVVVKIVDIKKDPLKPSRHGVAKAPTILLLKDGREVERMSGNDGEGLLEALFRKANT